jgi:hypothetical protein
MVRLVSRPNLSRAGASKLYEPRGHLEVERYSSMSHTTPQIGYLVERFAMKTAPFSTTSRQ